MTSKARQTTSSRRASWWLPILFRNGQWRLSLSGLCRTLREQLWEKPLPAWPPRDADDRTLAPTGFDQGIIKLSLRDRNATLRATSATMMHFPDRPR